LHLQACIVVCSPGPATRQAHALLEAATAADLPRLLCELLEACARIGLGPGGGEGGACTASVRLLAALCAPLSPVRARACVLHLRAFATVCSLGTAGCAVCSGGGSAKLLKTCVYVKACVLSMDGGELGNGFSIA